MARAGKVETTLDRAQLEEFTKILINEPKPNLERIQELFEDFTGEYISKPGAATYRDNVLIAEAERLKAAQELSMQLAGMKQEGSEDVLIDSARLDLARQALNAISKGDLDIEAMKDLSQVIRRLGVESRDSKVDEAKLRIAEAKLKELQQKEDQRLLEAENLRQRIEKEKSNGKGISEETMALIEQKVGLL